MYTAVHPSGFDAKSKSTKVRGIFERKPSVACLHHPLVPKVAHFESDLPPSNHLPQFFFGTTFLLVLAFGFAAVAFFLTPAGFFAAAAAFFAAGFFGVAFFFFFTAGWIAAAAASSTRRTGCAVLRVGLRDAAVKVDLAPPVFLAAGFLRVGSFIPGRYINPFSSYGPGPFLMPVLYTGFVGELRLRLFPD